MAMKYLISYRIQEMTLTDQGIVSSDPYDVIDLFEEHPATLVADTRRRARELEGLEYAPSNGPQLAYEVLCIYSVVQVPEGTLTEDQESYLVNQ